MMLRSESKARILDRVSNTKGDFSFCRAEWSIDCTTRSSQYWFIKSNCALYYSEFGEGDALCKSIGSPEVTCCIADASIDVSTSPSNCDVTIGAAVTCFYAEHLRFCETCHKFKLLGSKLRTWRICCWVPFAPRVKTGVTDRPPTLADVVPDPSSIPFESDFGRDVINGPNTW